MHDEPHSLGPGTPGPLQAGREKRLGQLTAAHLGPYVHPDDVPLPPFDREPGPVRGPRLLHQDDQLPEPPSLGSLGNEVLRSGLPFGGPGRPVLPEGVRTGDGLFVGLQKGQVRHRIPQRVEPELLHRGPLIGTYGPDHITHAGQSSA